MALRTFARSTVALLPGIALLAAVGVAGKLTEQSIGRYGKAHAMALPNIEYVFWAIVFGAVITNVIGLPQIFRAGVATYEFWLKTGIIFMGARFLLGDVARLGGVSLLLVVVEIAGALLFMTWLGTRFRLPPKVVLLLAVGSSVCGVSAIIATQGAIDAEEEDASVAIAAILALGALSLFVFPLIGHALHMSDHAYGLWTGLAVDNTAETAAAGSLYSDAAGKIAVLTKTCRNAMIGFVVLGYALHWSRKGQAAAVTGKAALVWQRFPKFVLGFLIVSALATIGFFTKPQVLALGNLSRWAFLLTFAGVGLRTDMRALRRQGLKPFAVGAIGEVAIAALTLALVLAVDRWSSL